MKKYSKTLKTHKYSYEFTITRRGKVIERLSGETTAYNPAIAATNASVQIEQQLGPKYFPELEARAWGKHRK